MHAWCEWTRWLLITYARPAQSGSVEASSLVSGVLTSGSGAGCTTGAAGGGTGGEVIVGLGGSGSGGIDDGVASMKDASFCAR